MSGAEANAACARAFVDELALAGVRLVCVAPGSRSTPLVLAAAAHPGLRTVVHHDERCAAFFALGAGKVAGLPAAVITTSGTAAANLLPAVVEAATAEVPLLVLTADRPAELRGSDANQTIDQVRLFGGYARAFREMPMPGAAPASVRHFRVQAVRAVADALGDPAGPVHVNFPFGKPLEPGIPAEAGDAGPGGEGRAPTLSVTPRRAHCGEEELGALAEALRGSERGVIVAGPVSRPAEVAPGLLRLAAASGLPLLADPLSGARYALQHGAATIPAYDLFLRDPEVRRALEPDFVLRVGQAPTSVALAEWLQDHHGVPQTVLDPGYRWKDHGLTASTYLRGDVAHALREVEALVRQRGSPEWRLRWLDLGEAARRTADGLLGESFQDGAVVAAVAEAVPAGTTLYVSASMPIRDLDAFAPPREVSLLTLGNRGASGIDGVVSAGFGAALAGLRPTVVLLGDVAFHHDLTGLFAARDTGAPVVFVVIHNDGGGIFHALPIRDHEPWFTPYFVTPHGLDFRHAADLYGVPCVEATDRDTLQDALARALAGGVGAGNDTTVIQVRTVAARAQEQRETIARAVSASARARLKEGETP